MDAERFESLTAAYGAEPGRWPEAERDAALAFQRDHGPAAARILFEARMLDAALAALPTQSADAALRARVLAGAPKPRAERRRSFAWLPGAGLATACLIGMIVGTFAAERVVAPVQADLLVAEAESGVDELEGAG